ncbi:MAG: FitA-like ribbon-helix-helix domain-containing protein [Terriglobales bacterium]
MSKMVQIRNMPDALHRKLRTRAAADGRSLSEYLLRELKKLAAQPTMEEWLERAAQLPRVHGNIDYAKLIREDRDHHY